MPLRFDPKADKHHVPRRSTMTAPRMTPNQATAYLNTLPDADYITAPPDEQIDAALAEQLIEAAHKVGGRPSLTSPGRHSPQITLRLPATVNDQLTVLANQTGRRRSQIVREAIDQYLAQAA